jgi:predicted nucleotidyltransferase
MKKSKKETMNHSNLNETESAALKEFAGRVAALLGAGYLYGMLFGSKARGEGSDYSDLDVALIVKTIKHDIKRDVIDLAYEEYLETGVNISPIVFSADEFTRMLSIGNPLAREIDRDKVPL